MNILPTYRPSRLRKVAAWAIALVLVTGLAIFGQAVWQGRGLPAAQAVDGLPDPSPSASPSPTPSAGPTNVPPEPTPPPPDPTPPPPEQPPPPPPPQYPSLPGGSGVGRRIVYGNSQQRIWIVEEDGTVAGSWPVSGRRGLPRPGTYGVRSKSRYSSARGGSIRFQYMVRYARGRRLWMGFHSIPVTRRGVPIQSESRLGTATSTGGCVRQRMSDAARLYDWAPMGTKVVVTP